MTTSVYAITFKDGKRCICIATEPASDAENIESIIGGFCGKVEGVEKVVPAIRSKNEKRID